MDEGGKEEAGIIEKKYDVNGIHFVIDVVTVVRRIEDLKRQYARNSRYQKTALSVF